MCGITGFISKDRNADVEQRTALLDRMCASIVYRGPDEQGMLVRDRAALGMRRLSIIDVDTGQQPIFTEAGNLAIVFNGEIYNFRELRAELEALGHNFKTNSDTEVVVHAYERFGADCLKKLRGMFAFAIWNFRDETLFAARDRVGKKPFFYSVTGGGNFVFGSELKTLLVHGELKREIDLGALDAYLTFGYVPEESCILKDVRKLLPGHYLTFKNGTVKSEKYWDFEYSVPQNIRTEAEYAEIIREKIDEAVRIRLISEVPLGAFLSGGVDSSIIVAMMSRAAAAPVKTFSIGFEEDSYDELKYARIAAKHFGTDHHEFIVTPELFDIAEELVRHFDEPFSDPSSLPTYMLSKMAREHVTVVLTGDGGDELFAGYSRYVTDKKRGGFSKLPKAVRNGLLRPASERLPHRAMGKNYLYNISLDATDRYIDSVSCFNGPRKSYLYSDDLKQRLNGGTGENERYFRALADSVSTGSDVDKLLYLDSKTYLPGDILTKVDRMTMANSIEARAPLLDQELIDLVVGIPSNMKMNGRETKHILKKSMEGLVPSEILYREKQGFGVPLAQWINTRLRGRIIDDLSADRTLQRGFFNTEYIQVLLSEHSNGRRDHSDALWVLWMFELWQREYIDG